MANLEGSGTDIDQVMGAGINKGESASSERGNLGERATTFYSKGMDRSRRAFSGVREHVDENPWMDIGIVAAFCLVAGYFVGSRMRANRGSRIDIRRPDVEVTAAEDLTLGRTY